MEKLRLVSFCLVSAFFLLACAQETPVPAAEPPAAEEAEPEEEEGELVAVIKTSKGNIVIQLLSEAAPQTVARFVELAKAGFYTRTTFHYVSQGFIWGGDPFSKDNNPLNDGLGNAGEWIEAEFSNEHEVGRGTVGMMRKDDQPDSSSCQFFVVLKRKKEWDGKYNIFGRVIEGIEVAEKIAKVPQVKTNPKLTNYPTAKQLIKGITIERRSLEAEEPEATA